MEDLKLYRDFRAGDDQAFSVLYQKYAESLMGYASVKLGSLDEARDIIHDLFVHLWEKRYEIEIKQSVKAYLFLSLNRRILNHYRKHSYRDVYATQLQKLEDQYFFGPDSFLDAKEIQQAVDESIGQMSAKVREVYLLSREQHLSSKEIAERLQISEQTVKNQLSTALSIIKKRVNQVLLDALFFFLYFLSE